MTKSRVVLTGLALCGLLGVLLTTTWVSGTPSGGLGGGAPVELTGSEASSLVRPALFTAVAGLLVAAFLGPVARRVAGVVVTLSGLAVAWAAAALLLDPEGPVTARAAEDWGLAGGAAVNADATASWAPWVAALLGVLLALVGVAVLVARWQGLGARYERRGQATRTEEPLWDSLSRGEDPT
ncbi:Trp biosynthesis-associated membrane protein [Kytococcus schroeteri]|uniref:Trp biosynthesis-associated membrane protein n=1 Tax=Kytococcus schroeteri TaxID=138300 RepID=UPI001142EC89|nr:Trp biosynthesis-associated membrane protein [Kytococcus schroeteri]